jgi:WD40 repeat protein
MDKTIKVWNAQTFELIKVIDKVRHAGHGTSINKLLWLPYHDYLISGSDDRNLSVWKVEFYEKQSLI